MCEVRTAEQHSRPVADAPNRFDGVDNAELAAMYHTPKSLPQRRPPAGRQDYGQAISAQPGSYYACGEFTRRNCCALHSTLLVRKIMEMGRSGTPLQYPTHLASKPIACARSSSIRARRCGTWDTYSPDLVLSRVIYEVEEEAPRTS
jgi:hypothetical protein